MMGGIAFCFSLNPHISDELYQAAIATFEEKNGIPKECWKKIAWPKEYVKGSQNESADTYKEWTTKRRFC